MKFDPVTICRILNEENVDYVVVGGFASVNLGSPLPTEDVDVLPERSEENLVRLANALKRMNAMIRTSDEALPAVPQVVEELDRIDELVSRGKSEETARNALEVATGFDATVTPLLPLGSRTAAGLELIVTSPTKVKRARYLPVKVQVDPKNVRGRMRMFLLRFDGETPVVVRKRTGFIGAGSKSKRFYIYRNDPVGKYAILTSFDPTTPGQVGVATMTPLTAVK